MLAAVLHAPRRFELTEVPRPEPGPDEVRVRLEGCGVCASNLAPWLGAPWFQYPFAAGAPGHEGWGRLDAVGSGAGEALAPGEALTPGQRVALLSQHAYAQYEVVPASAVVLLPAALDGQPFPAEPLACVLNAFRRAGVAAGQTVAVVGTGFFGALTVQLAARAGARVVALTRRPSAAATARQMGAEHVVTLPETEDALGPAVEQVRALTAGRGCEVVVEATGQQLPLTLAAELTAERGRLVIAGFHQGGPRLVNLQLWNWRGLDVINAHERDPRVYVAGMREAVRRVAAGALDPGPLYTHALPLARLNEAMTLAYERPAGFLKAWVTLD